MKVLVLFLFFVYASSFTIRRSLASEDTEILANWIKKVKNTYQVSKFEDLVAEKLLAVGTAYIKLTKTVILPGESFKEAVHYDPIDTNKDKLESSYYFYEYDANNFVTYTKEDKSVIGAVLNNQYSSTKNSVSSSITVEDDRYFKFIRGLSSTPLSTTTETGFLKGRIYSATKSCSVDPGGAVGILLTIASETYMLEKRDIHITVQKLWFTSPTFNIYTDDWLQAEFEVVTHQQASCVNDAKLFF